MSSANHSRNPSVNGSSNGSDNSSQFLVPVRNQTLLLEAGTRSLEPGTPSTAVGPQRVQSKPKTSWFKRKIPAILRPSGPFLKPASEVGPIPTVKESLRAIVVSSWLNIFLVCIPICWVLHFVTPNQHAAIFFTGFFAIIPLAKLLAFATDELSLRVGQAFAGLISATLGNAVELIVAILALAHCELQIVQSSLIGSILSNLLLVLGMCFFFGGIKYSEQGFATGAAQLNSSLLTLSVVAVLLPGAYQMTQKPDDPADTAAANTTQAQILKFSHGIAIILLFIYGCYLLFQLGSHTKMYQDDSADIVKSTAYESRTPADGKTVQLQTIPIFTEEPLEEGESPQLNGLVCMLLLGAVTALVALTADFLVGSIDGLTSSGAMSKEFVGIILLPIVGNAAEHLTAVTVARKDKLTLSLGVAVGSSIQIALFVIPFSVLIAWAMGKPMTLLFDPYEAICLFLAVLTVNYVVQDGKSNWLEGMILMCLYAILGTLFFFYPGMPAADHFAVCT